ncbi:S9 family peptidase [Pseudorhodoferax sp.]|uniref:S9 family peptidase n=1 Tax=Pseudorhodoferax sp. TaxID=1993553 RepID=UPI002DD67A99|nr:alpha/beta fold hydrolase [Pseudorhodoferax sp.]
MKLNRRTLSALLAGAPLLSLAQAGAETMTPPAALHIENIPAIPKDLAQRMAAYTEFRGHGFADWHPTKAEMLVSHRAAGASTAQLFRLDAAMGELKPVTQGPEPAGGGSYEPKAGRYIVFARSSGGNEVTQLYRQGFDGAAALQITHSDERNGFAGWRKPQGEIVYTSVPIDRTAQGGKRSQIITSFWAVDPEAKDSIQARRKLVELEGGGWGGSVSEDGKRMALSKYISANESQLWVMELEGEQAGKPVQLLPKPGSSEAKAVYFGSFLPDSRTLLVATDRFGEFRELTVLDAKTQELQRITAHIPWDISGGDVSADGRTLVLQANADGRDEMHWVDTRSWKELPLPKVAAGSVGSTRFHPSLPLLAYSVSSPKGPSQLYVLDDKGVSQPWSKAAVPAGIDTQAFADTEIVRWKSFDGLPISGLMNRPPAHFKGKRPVLISIHGGPEGQATVGFLSRWQYFVQELGLVLIQPNVRGSSGFGKSFLAMDNGFKREDSVRDIGALLDWIKTQPELDAERVVVVGGSYGGYMSLAVATHYSERIAGAIDVVGISHFVTFLNNTESYRRDLRRVEYGDERDPAMRAHLEKISPLSNAHRIKKPLFVIQGKNDPRVPYTEAEQIVAKVREQGTPVWYLRADNEGHGFAKKENSDYMQWAMLLFMQQTMLR